MTNLAPRGSCELTSTLRVPLAVHSPVIRNPTPVMSCQDNFHVKSARWPAAAGRRLRSNLAKRGSGGCDPKGCHLLDQILAVDSELVRLGLFAGDFLVRRGALDDVLTSLNKRGGHLVELGLTAKARVVSVASGRLADSTHLKSLVIRERTQGIHCRIAPDAQDELPTQRTDRRTHNVVRSYHTRGHERIPCR